ncbi:hypothetical protein D3C76_1716280 [compost metagenome]
MMKESPITSLIGRLLGLGRGDDLVNVVAVAVDVLHIWQAIDYVTDSAPDVFINLHADFA